MSTTWGTVLDRAKRGWGLSAGVAHPVYTDDWFLDEANRRLRELATRGGNRELFTLDLSGSSALHSLSGRVVRVLDGTVRIDYDGDGVYEIEPDLIDEQELRGEEGVIENATATVPQVYFTARGSAADAMLQLVLFPRSDTARTNGVQLWAHTAPAVLTDQDSTLPLQVREEDHLLPGLWLSCAELEWRRGRENGLALVQREQALWDAAAAGYEASLSAGLSGRRRRIHCVRTRDDDY